jgi:hypothetical protein
MSVKVNPFQFYGLMELLNADFALGHSKLTCFKGVMEKEDSKCQVCPFRGNYR